MELEDTDVRGRGIGIFKSYPIEAEVLRPMMVEKTSSKRGERRTVTICLSIFFRETKARFNYGVELSGEGR